MNPYLFTVIVPHDDTFVILLLFCFHLQRSSITRPPLLGLWNISPMCSRHPVSFYSSGSTRRIQRWNTIVFAFWTFSVKAESTVPTSERNMWLVTEKWRDWRVVNKGTDSFDITGTDLGRYFTMMRLTRCLYRHWQFWYHRPGTVLGQYGATAIRLKRADIKSTDSLTQE